MKKQGGLGVAGLTPLLDTLFLLLFALLALTQSRTTGKNDTIRVELPNAEPGSQAQSADIESIQIELAADGAVRVAGQDDPLASLTDLDPALGVLLGDALPESVRIEIVADAEAPYGVAVTLLQHLRLAGFSRVGLLAHKQDQPALPRRGGER